MSNKPGETLDARAEAFERGMAEARNVIEEIVRYASEHNDDPWRLEGFYQAVLKFVPANEITSALSDAVRDATKPGTN